MKKYFIVCTLLLAGLAGSAQAPWVKPIPRLKLDSIRATLGRGLYGGPQRFEALNPGAVQLKSTARGKVYALRPDNMRVLSPDMTQLEKMPGSSRTYRPAPPSRMPNPLFPKRKNS